MRIILLTCNILKLQRQLYGGNADGSRNNHVWCSRTNKLNQTVDRLKSYYPAVLEMQFDDFEH